MPYHFTCPHCGSATLVDDQFSGQSGPCVACGQNITLPMFATAAPKVTRPFFVSLGKPARWLFAGLMGISITVLLIGLIRVASSAAQRAQAASVRGKTLSNLQKIAQALNEYADDYGTYPPPYTVDSKGQPLLSWRVAILPYLGYQDLYNQFKRGASWKDPENLDLQGRMPLEYLSANSTRYDLGYTNFYLITGPATLFPPDAKPYGPKKITDGLEETLLVVEAASVVDTTWTEPTDLDTSRMSYAIGSTPGVEIGGTLEGGAGVATADGRPRFIKKSLSVSLLKALISPAGNEAIPDDALDN